MSLTIEQGATLRNALNGETFVFSGLIDAEDVARMDIRLDPNGSGGGDALVHVHPLAEETIPVRADRLTVTVDGRDHRLAPGGKMAIAPGQPHTFVNAGDDPVEMRVELRPAQDHMRFFANFATTVEKHPQWYSASGKPAFLLIALTLHVYADHLYPAGPPRALLKALFAMLAPIARWRGYRVLVAPRG